jgi:hypothetical protein
VLLIVLLFFKNIYDYKTMKQMEEDKKVVVLVISNIEQNVHLFRIHIHEKSIRFDERFSTGIQKNPELKEEINEINYLWEQHKINGNQIFPIMLQIMHKYGDYLQDYYFDETELDDNGKLMAISFLKKFNCY